MGNVEEAALTPRLPLVRFHRRRTALADAARTVGRCSARPNNDQASENGRPAGQRCELFESAPLDFERFFRNDSGGGRKPTVVLPICPNPSAACARPRRSASHALNDADLLDLPIDLWPYGILAARAWKLTGNLSIYDASYVALAEMTATTLATLDSRIARARGSCAIARPPS